MKSWAKPTPELVTRAIAGMLHSEQQRYFFDRLENPEWIEPLRKAKFFTQLPTPVQEQNSTGYYRWPASRYLSRMAHFKPDLVAEIMSEFPATENPFVVHDILAAASSMPPASSAKLAEAVARAAHGGGFVGMDRAGEVATSLARGGELNASLKVLRSILEIVPDPRPTTISPSGREYRHEARTRIRSFDYGNILRSYGADLTSFLGARYLELLSGKLVFALSQEYPYDRKTHRVVEDHSYIWRPHLEFGNSREEAKQLLVSGVFQSAESMVSTGGWNEALRVLQQQPFMVFERIQFYLLAKNPDLDLNRAMQKVTDADLFHDFGLRQEFNQLAHTIFPLLSNERQERFLSLIDKGFDTNRMIERGLSGEQIQQLVSQWKLERYEPIRDHLPPERLKEFEELEKEFGKASRYENPVVRGGAVALGGQSPVSSEELQSLSVDELFHYLKSWSPDARKPFGPTHQGLGRELSETVAGNPDRYWNRLDGFKALQPTYVRAALQGFREATRNGVTLAWRPLLEMSQWICEQPADPITQATESYWHAPDPGWQPTRFAIVDILEDAFRKDLLPITERETVWKIIDSLANDGADCLDYREQSSQEKDVWSYSLNTLRPRAIRVALNYIEWLSKRLKVEGVSIQAAPEIVQFLDRHLDVDAEKCLSVRLIYGEKLPFLNAVAPEWVPGAVARIFPNKPDLQSLRDVAWGAYLAANQAYTNLFLLLEGLYRDAIQDDDESRKQGKSHILDRPSSLLGQHLIQLYWWGQIDLAEGSVLTDFVAAVNGKALRSVITYVGRSLSEARNSVGEDVISRLQLLWDHILTSENAKNSREVFANFGWWFNTPYFGDAWALDRLNSSLVFANGSFEPALEALSRLSRLAESHPKPVLECTRMIVLAAREFVDLWNVDLGSILETLLQSGDAALSIAATSLINELGKRGYLSFRTLLSSNSGS